MTWWSEKEGEREPAVITATLLPLNKKKMHTKTQLRADAWKECKMFFNEQFQYKLLSTDFVVCSEESPSIINDPKKYIWVTRVHTHL